MSHIAHFSALHALLVLCAFGAVASVAFHRSVPLSQSKLAHAVYLVIFCGLGFLYWSRAGGRLMAGGRFAAFFGVLMVVAGWLVVLAFNVVPFYYMIEHYLSALLAFVTSDDQIVVRKTYDHAEGAESQADYEKAAELYSRETEADPNDREAHRRLAEVLLKLDRKQEAVEEFNRVLETSEGQEEVCAAAFRLAEVLEEELRDYVRAGDFYRMILRDHPESRHARYAATRLERMADH